MAGFNSVAVMATASTLFVALPAANAVPAERARGTVIACVDRSDGDLRAVKRASACGPTERVVKWKIQGKRGKRGAVGAARAQDQCG